MNYQTASKQQLLAERARLQMAYRKIEQRSGTQAATAMSQSAAAGRGRSAGRVPKKEIEQIAGQLARVEAELKRRDEPMEQVGAAGEEQPASS